MTAFHSSSSRELADCRIAIVGLGLMGASMATALKGRCNRTIGVTRRAEIVEDALVHGFIDQGTLDLAEGVQNADIVILATPVRVILRHLDEIAPYLPTGCLVLDLGSTKTEIVAKMASLPEHIQPLGGHPMCGKEVSGFAAADASLYQGCTFVLSPLPRTSDAALKLGQTLVKAVGARPLILEPERHDVAVATASHLPYLLACALVSTAGEMASREPVLWDIAASGFRDTSRLAASDVTMMIDILSTNRAPMLRSLSAYSAALRNFAAAIELDDEDGLRAALDSARQRRTAM